MTGLTPTAHASEQTSDTTSVDHLVIGGGVIGLAAAWQLAQRGHSVHLLERFEAHHKRGASHGSTRNMNNAYDEDVYLDLYDEALALWHDLEAATGTELLSLHGLVTHGDETQVEAARVSLEARGASIELLDAAAAEARWQGMRFRGPVLLSHNAGVVNAARALDAFTDAATHHGATITRGVRVTGIDPAPDRVRVEAITADGAPVTFVASNVTVAAGAWSAGLLAEHVTLPQLTVTEEHPAHFPERSAAHDWPSFNHFLPSNQLDAYDGNVYGMQSPGEGVKVGFHRVGAVIDPDDRVFRASDEQRAQLGEYVAKWFPGLDVTRPEEISCTYTSTPTGRFLLDQSGRLTVAAGFSGHGFKFAPAIGRVLADAATGVGLPPEMFRIDAHLDD